MSRIVLLAAALLLLVTSHSLARESVMFAGYAPGTIVVRTHERSLYYVTGPMTALRYPVGVGRAGKTWSGEAYIQQKGLNPAWAPPPDVRADNPRLPQVIEGGAPNNPLGVAVMVLNRGGYAIHGTNRPQSIGNFVSYGCIRMHNRDVMDLYRMARLGTRVVVLP